MSTSRHGRSLGRLEEPRDRLGHRLGVCCHGPVAELTLGLGHVQHEGSGNIPRMVADGALSAPAISTSTHSCPMIEPIVGRSRWRSAAWVGAVERPAAGPSRRQRDQLGNVRDRRRVEARLAAGARTTAVARPARAGRSTTRASASLAARGPRRAEDRGAQLRHLEQQLLDRRLSRCVPVVARLDGSLPLRQRDRKRGNPGRRPRSSASGLRCRSTPRRSRRRPPSRRGR